MAIDDSDPELLICQARAGDRRVLGELLELYRRYLTLLARMQIGRRLQMKADAADVVQETFLEAFAHFGGFRGGSEAEFVAWLRQILSARLANLIRSYYGAQRRNVRVEQQLADEMDNSSRALNVGLVDRHSSPSQRTGRRERAVLLANALEQLPEHYREVILMSHVECLNFAEIASRMGRSEDSVKNIWARALARLRQSLKDSV